MRKRTDGEALAAAHTRIQPIPLDVCDAASVAAAAAQVRGEVGNAGLDGLVNNAGVALIAPLELMPAEEFARVFDVNVTGPLRVTQEFLPLLRTAKGRIINMGSQVRLAAGVGGKRCMKLETLIDACVGLDGGWRGHVRDSLERSRIPASARTAAPSSR